MIIGFNLTFGPMHWLGLQGQVRRTWVYAEETNLGFWNLIVTIGAFILAIATLVLWQTGYIQEEKVRLLLLIPGTQEQLSGVFLLLLRCGISNAPEVKSLDDFGIKSMEKMRMVEQ